MNPFCISKEHGNDGGPALRLHTGHFTGTLRCGRLRIAAIVEGCGQLGVHRVRALEISGHDG